MCPREHFHSKIYKLIPFIATTTTTTTTATATTRKQFSSTKTIYIC
jgi:hypothetical protein